MKTKDEILKLFKCGSVLHKFLSSSPKNEKKKQFFFSMFMIGKYFSFKKSNQC